MEDSRRRIEELEGQVHHLNTQAQGTGEKPAPAVFLPLLCFRLLTGRQRRS